MSEPLYQLVYERLRDDIRGHRFPVGERLPSEAELTAEHKVSTITLKRALSLLRDDGFIVRRPRLGTFVVSDVATSTTVSLVGRPLIGCVITNFDDTFGTHILGGLLDSMQTSANLILKRSLGDPAAEDGLIRSLIESGMQALILQPSSSQYVPPAVLELVLRQFPVVILDRVFDGVPVSTVCSDNVAAAKMATEYLFTLGHDHVGLVTSAGRMSTTENRRAGFLHAHAAANVPHEDDNEFRDLQSTTPGSDVLPEDDVARLQVFIANHPDLTGFVASEYNIALLLKEACRRAGRSVPEDVSIVCFDHPDNFYDPAYFRFTHIQQNQAQMGVEAVERVLEQLRKPSTIRKIALPTKLVEGQSTTARRTERIPAYAVALRRRGAVGVVDGSGAADAGNS
jgi:DNA-binding LacI/PurR family transcriptional regulator